VALTYPIQVVVRETGLSAHVLRVWEKRYGAVVPERTKTQRRTYSEAEVARLKLLRRVTLLGHPIGSIATLPERELEQLVKGSGSDRSAPAEAPRSTEDLFVAQCLEAVRAFDAEALQATLERASVASGHMALLQRVVAPLAQKIGELWSDGSLRPAHEHFATAAIRGFLLNRARQYSAADANATVIAATPQGQMHELGAVMAAALASENGWRAIYLGPSLPAAEIAGAALQNHARAIALSVVHPDDDPNLGRELQDLRRFVPRDLPILIGGQAAERYRGAIEAAGALLVIDLGQLAAELAAIRAHRQ